MVFSRVKYKIKLLHQAMIPGAAVKAVKPE